MTLQQSNNSQHHNSQQHSRKDEYLDPRLWTPELREMIYHLAKYVTHRERRGKYVRRGQWFRVRTRPRGKRQQCATVEESDLDEYEEDDYYEE